MFGNFRLGLVRFGALAWDLWHWIFCLESIAWELSLEHFRLITLVWDPLFGNFRFLNFRFGTLANERWLKNSFT